MEFSEDPTSSSSSSRSLISSSTLNRPPFPKSISHWFPVDNNNDDQPYITSLLSLSSSNLLASSDSEKHPLRIYDKNNINSSQPFININWSNPGRITSINRSPFQSEGGDEDSSHFIATSSNGLLAHFDIRSGSIAPSTLMRVPGGRNTPYLSAGSSYSGNLVAAGRELESNEACVDLWDVRQPTAPILTFTESHSDDITSLHFLPPSAASTSNGSSSKTTSHLLTSSTDGLISIIDTSIGENEDDSVLSVGNLGASVARSGWSGYKSLPSNNGGMDVDNDEEVDTPKLGLPDVWAVSDMQTLATFNTDGFDPILSPIDARGPTCIQPPWSTDYVIDAFDSKSLGMDQEVGLKLFCGDQNGAFSIISISSKDSDLNQTPWRLEALFPSGMNGGHCDIVRCVDWDRRSQTLFTGGEDGRICSWDFSSSSSSNANQNQSLSTLPTSIPSNDESELSSNGGKDRNGNGSSKKEKRFKPYG